MFNDGSGAFRAGTSCVVLQSSKLPGPSAVLQRTGGQGTLDVPSAVGLDGGNLFLRPLDLSCNSPAFLATCQGWLVIGKLLFLCKLFNIVPDPPVPFIHVLGWYCMSFPRDLVGMFFHPWDLGWLAPHWHHGWSVQVVQENFDDSMVSEHGPV